MEYWRGATGPGIPDSASGRARRFGPAVCGGAVGLGAAHGRWHQWHAAPCWQVKATEQAHPAEPTFEPEAACPEPLGLS